MRKHIDLFTGIGGFTLACQWNGIETVVMCEKDERCRQFLERTYSEIPVIEDVRDFTIDTLVSLYYNRLQKPEQGAINMGVQDPKYDNAVTFYDSGLSIQDVADFYQITRQAMWMILKRRGCEFRDQRKYGNENHFSRHGEIYSKRVHHITEVAISKGVLIRKTHCEKCQSTKGPISAHHSDYNLPLNVEWLCKKCHFEWHRDNKPIELKIDLPKMSKKEISSRGGSRKEVMPDEFQRRIEEATATYILTAGVP